MFASRLCRTALMIALVSCTAATGVAKVEAVKGKRYRLSPKHGPWMIMVAAMRDVPEERRIEGGMTAWEAADALVYELRKLGIPAYTYLQRMKTGTVNGHAGQTSRYIAQTEAIAVLAGNFSSPDMDQAKLILNYLKTKFRPEFLQDQSSGAVVRETPGRPTPLSRAHMTTNPLMPDEQINRKTLDPLVRQLNSGDEYSLLKNPGRYSLRIATFKGTSIYQVGNKVHEKAHSNFEKMFGSNLDEAGTRAWELTQAMRSAKKLGYGQNFEAYVFHDRYESYVTVGSFESRNDPRIAEYARMFHAKTRSIQGNEELAAESFSIPRKVAPGREPEKFWMFDVKPTLIEVPKIRR